MESQATLTIRRPDDWHVHLRDGAMLELVAPYTARRFARAIVMPNLSPPVTDAAAARAYRDRIVAALPPGIDFTPLMTCYLTDATDAAALIAMAYVIVSERLHDQAFCDRHVHGLAEYRAYLLGETDGVAKTPEWAEKITGIDAVTLHRLAIEFATTKPAAMQTGYAPGREHGINPLDPGLALPLPEGIDFLLSDKDAAAPTLEQAAESGLLPTWEACREYVAALR